MAEWSYLDAQPVRGSELLGEIARITAGQNDVLAQGILEAGRGIGRGLEARAEGRQRERLLTMQQEAAMELMREKRRVEDEEGAYGAEAMATLFSEVVPGASPGTVEAVRRLYRHNPEAGRFVSGRLMDSARADAAAKQDAMRLEAMRAGSSAGLAELAAATNGGYLDEDERGMWEARISGAETPSQLNSVLGELGRTTRKAREKAGVQRQRESDLKKLRTGVADLVDTELRQQLAAEIEVLEGSTKSPAEWAKDYDDISRKLRGITDLPGGLGTELDPPHTLSSWGITPSGEATTGPTGEVERMLREKAEAAREEQFQRDAARAEPAAGQRGYADLSTEEQDRVIAFLTEFDGSPDEFDAALAALSVDIETIPAEVRLRIREARMRPPQEPKSLKQVERDKRGGMNFIPTRPVPARTPLWSVESRSPL